MEIFMNQGRDSTIEPAYLAEKKQVTPKPNLITLDVTPTSETQTITPESPVDGYSQVNVAAASSVTLVEKTIRNTLTPINSDDVIFNPEQDAADGYSLVTLKAPSAEEVEAEWIEVHITVNLSDKTVTFDSTEEELAEIMRTKQTNQPKFYLNVTTEI